MRSSVWFPGPSPVMLPFHIIKQIVIDEHGMNKADKDHKQGKGENPDHHIKHIDDNGFI